MKKNMYPFLFCLLVPFISSACSCLDFIYFCESVTQSSHVVRGEILNKYEVEGMDEFDKTFYMDVLVVENILGDLTVDTINIVNSSTSCDLYHDGFEIGDEVILNSIDENRIDDLTGRPFASPGGCGSTLLRLGDDGIVKGGIREDLKSQTLDEFRSSIGTCSDLTALDRWIEKIDQRLHVFPNPSSENVFVRTSFRLEEELTFELYNATGQLVQKELFNFDREYNLRVKDYPRGVYFLKIKIRDQSLVRRIVKK